MAIKKKNSINANKKEEERKTRLPSVDIKKDFGLDNKIRIEITDEEINARAKPIFIKLKLLEFFGVIGLTYGAYLFGVLIDCIFLGACASWFITWVCGIIGLMATIVILYSIYAIIKYWIISNWKWARKIAIRKLKDAKRQEILDDLSINKWVEDISLAEAVNQKYGFEQTNQGNNGGNLEE